MSAMAQIPNLIPTPRKLECGVGKILVSDGIRLEVPGGDEQDRFAAEHLRKCLADEHGIGAGALVVRLLRSEGPAEGYRLVIDGTGITITGSDAAGVYYGTQTLRQCLVMRDGVATFPHLRIDDEPALAHRAMHYDTKHHQDTYAYVQSFITELASYKANLLVWEWEDKLAYRSHPQVGAPGAFTSEQMQELTRFARQHHVELVPLVQGLGHVAFILKHPEFRHLRELPDSDWEFCPLKDGSYELLFELWTEAMEATPGSRYFHIGSDETYELGLGTACGCAAHAATHGKDSLMRLFIDRCCAWVEAQGRTCLSWGGEWKPGTTTPPRPSMIWVDGAEPQQVKASADAGYPCWIYAPNTGVTPLVVFSLPWNKSSRWHSGSGGTIPGGVATTSHAIRTAIAEGSVRGSITTSWDDSGLHNQMWMAHFICACEYSWNPDGCDPAFWLDRFFANYFGERAYALHECQELMQLGALFYDDTFQRRVWHWGDVGKMHLPDFPREGLEYDPFWRKRYGTLLRAAKEQRLTLERAAWILERNRSLGVRHVYDIEVMLSCVQLMRHNVELILDLGRLEELLERASYTLHATDRRGALGCLREMETLIAAHLADRERVYAALVACWERTRLPKGCSVDGRTYFQKRERARHFANRTTDLRYLVLDEDLLDLEGYLRRLRTYNDHYGIHEVGS